MSKTAIVIGAGFSGLSVSACLAKAGFKVTVL
jgi:phytoene dehydrogenase-like protein